MSSECAFLLLDVSPAAADEWSSEKRHTKTLSVSNQGRPGDGVARTPCRARFDPLDGRSRDLLEPGTPCPGMQDGPQGQREYHRI